jgi:phosphoribosylaminoimidazole-succinocarboxamide synthase
MSDSGLGKTDFNFPGQTSFARGSVRDIYEIKNKYLAMVVTDRISAFDFILPVTIPHKGQVLAQIAKYFLESTKDILPNWLISSPDPKVLIGHACQSYKIEMVIRGYLTGHAWREYQAGKRELCGATMPEGMVENQKFPEPIITPATHAEEGHDEDISPEEIVKRDIIPKKHYQEIEKITRRLFERGTEMAAKQDLILVDTKYEFGLKDGKIVLIDEIHTPDSSRYFYADEYAKRQADGQPQRQLSKEFVREWLIDHGFQGLDGQKIPDIPNEFVKQISERYIELYEKLVGHKFKNPIGAGDIKSRIESKTREALSRLS